MVENGKHSPSPWVLVVTEYCGVRSKGRDRERQIIVQIMKSISSIKPFYCALKTTICYELLTSGKSWESEINEFAMRSSFFGPFVGLLLSQ